MVCECSCYGEDLPFLNDLRTYEMMGEHRGEMRKLFLDKALDHQCRDFGAIISKSEWVEHVEV